MTNSTEDKIENWYMMWKWQYFNENYSELQSVRAICPTHKATLTNQDLIGRAEEDAFYSQPPLLCLECRAKFPYITLQTRKLLHSAIKGRTNKRYGTNIM